MISLETIEKEIMELEKRDTSYATVERLAWLYVVRDHLQAAAPEKRTGEIEGTEFCKCCSDVPVSQLVQILSEHMECIRAIYPKEYDAIIQRIKATQ